MKVRQKAPEMVQETLKALTMVHMKELMMVLETVQETGLALGAWLV